MKRLFKISLLVVVLLTIMSSVQAEEAWLTEALDAAVIQHQISAEESMRSLNMSEKDIQTYMTIIENPEFVSKIVRPTLKSVLEKIGFERLVEIGNGSFPTREELALMFSAGVDIGRKAIEVYQRLSPGI